MPFPSESSLLTCLRRNCLALVIVAAVPSTIRAQAQTITLEVQPSSVTAVVSGPDIQVRVILKNNSDSPVTKVSLSTLNTDGATVEIRAPSAPSAPKGQTIVWPLVLTKLRSVRLPLTILFEATYYQPERAAQRAYASLQVSAQQEVNQKPVEASVEGNFGAISEQRPAPGFLLVTNNLDVPVHVQVCPFGTEDIRVGQLRKAENQREEFSQISPFDVPPRSIVSTRIDLQAQSKITPGTYPVVLELIAEWQWGGHSEQRRLVVAKQATVGIFFESELLKALGIPSFLVLPGCLVLFTFQIVLSFGVLGLKNDSRFPQFAVTSPSFWVLAITLSGLFAVVYNFFSSDNYLVRYGLSDLRNVWLLSIGAGLVLYFAVAFLHRRYRREVIFTINDSQTTVLRKLSRNGLPIVLSGAGLKINNVALQAFVIEGIEDDQTRVWVAPPIVTEWGSAKEALDAQTQFEDSVNKRSSPGELATRLEEAQQKGYVQVRWNTQGSVPNPTHAKVEWITDYRSADVIVT